MPITAKIKIIIPRINVKLPSAPIDWPIIDIRRFNVCQDLANLNTRNFIEQRLSKTKPNFNNREEGLLPIEMNVEHSSLWHWQDLIQLN